MSDIMKETDKNDVDDILEMNDITDEELMDDLGLDLGNSLKAAFDSSKISVSEELIAATMAKIKMLEQEEKKESDADTDTEINGTDAGIMLNGKATETKTAGEHGDKGNDAKATETPAIKAIGTKPAETSENVVSINDKKRRFRSIMRIAGPVAAALIIGIFSLSVVRNNLMTKESANDANIALSTESAYYTGAENGSALKESQYNGTESTAKTAVPEAVKSEEYGVMENSEMSEWSTADIQYQDDADGSMLTDEKNLKAAGEDAELDGIIESAASFDTDDGNDAVNGNGTSVGTDTNIDAITGRETSLGTDFGGSDGNSATAPVSVENSYEDTKNGSDVPMIEESSEEDTEDEITGYIYAIPVELAGNIREITAGYAAGTITAAEYAGIAKIDARMTMRDGMDASGASDGTGTHEETGTADMTGSQEGTGEKTGTPTEIETTDGGEAPADPGTSEITGTPTEPAEEIYLVIGNGVFYFTSNPDLKPEEETIIYLLEDPENRTAAMIEELDNIPELKWSEI